MKCSHITGFFYCVVTSCMVSMDRSFIIVEDMLCKLLLNSCSFNEVQPKDKLFSKGLFLRAENGNVLCKQNYLGHAIPGV